MKGFVDEQLRALIPIRVTGPNDDESREFPVWIDTAFNGSLVLPRSTFEELKLVMESSAEAILADGYKVDLETFGCSVEWFGKHYDTQVVTNDSEYGLLGTMLLVGRQLTVDYESQTVELR
jgi:clan AA aspartic protease